MQNGTVPLENTWAVSDKVKHTFTMTPRSLTPGIKLVSFKRNKNTHPQKDLCANVYSGYIHNSQETGNKKNSPSAGKWINKTVAHPHNEILLSNINEQGY